MWAPLTAFVLGHQPLLWIVAAIVALEPLRGLLQWRNFPRLASLARHIEIMSASIFLGIVAGIASEQFHFNDVFSGANNLVASVVAGSLTTGITLYVAMFVIQLPAMGRQIENSLQKNIFGVDGFDVKRTAVQTALDELPRFAVASAEFPIFFSDADAAETDRQLAIDPGSVTGIAFGLVLGHPCTTDGIAKGFDHLVEKFGGKFTHVLLLERVGSRYSVWGVSNMFSFAVLLHPTHESLDKNVAGAIAERVASYANSPDRTRFFFEVSGFIANKIEANKDIRSMIAELVHQRRNIALVTRRGVADGIANLWNLVHLAYGYETRPANVDSLPLEPAAND